MKAHLRVTSAIGILALSAAATEVRAVGGDTCGTAAVITGPLPYMDTGNTCAFGDHYGEQCPTQDSSPDVVYRYVPASSECVDIVLCNMILSEFEPLLGLIRAALARDGSAVLSGILECERNAVDAMLEDSGMRVVGERELRGWISLRAARLESV